MLYQALRGAANAALHWYYADVVVQGREHIPQHGPVIITANHPNALVDALVVGITMRRRVLLTAKATLFENPFLAALLRRVGVVPLRRARDEQDGGTPASATSRNLEAFRAVTQALAHERTVLVFPEGVSHDAPKLAPLKTGAARMALAASSEGTRGLRILPIGLLYERKERPRSRVLVRIGAPIDVDAWLARTGVPDAAWLTAEIDAAMRRVTLNFASEARADQAIALARALAAISGTSPSVDQPPPLAIEAEIARRIETVMAELANARLEAVRQADAFIARVESLEARLAAHHITITDVHISPAVHPGARFVLREGGLALLAFPVALVGRLVHWAPLQLARWLALRTSIADRDQPAMRTIVLGLAFVLFWYGLQGAVAAHWIGWIAALTWLVAVSLAARVDFALRDRLHRGWRRARTYRALRANPQFREQTLAEIRQLIADALALEQALAPVSSVASR